MNTSSLVTANKWLISAAEELFNADIDSARLDSVLILEDYLNIPRYKLLSQAKDINLSSDDLKNLRKTLNRRISFEPMAYIRGFVEFYGRKIKVNANVLIPRPESEAFINLLKFLGPKPGERLVDIGSGSGCLGITAKLEFPNIEVDLIDNSGSANKIAKQNADFFNAAVNIIKGNLLENSHIDYRFAIANLPYVPDSFELDKSTAHEPKEAIFSGPDGLSLYQELFDHLKTRSAKPRYLIVESLENQQARIVKLAAEAGYAFDRKEGLVQVFTSQV